MFRTWSQAGDHLSELNELRDLYDKKLLGLMLMGGLAALVPILLKVRHTAVRRYVIVGCLYLTMLM